MMRVVLAFPYTTEGGRQYRAGTSITVDPAEGQRLIYAGLARKADTDNGSDEPVEPPAESEDSTNTPPAAEPPAEEG